MITPAALPAALRLIGATPGYEEVGRFLAKLWAQNRIRLDWKTEDRARASLLGTITLGPEAVASSALSLAQTLVHEAHHLHQNPLLKTVSFWSGIATRTPIMRRYERPAYQAALNFLAAVRQSHPHLAAEVEHEQSAIRQVFATVYDSALDEIGV